MIFLVPPWLGGMILLAKILAEELEDDLAYIVKEKTVFTQMKYLRPGLVNIFQDEDTFPGKMWPWNPKTRTLRIGGMDVPVEDVMEVWNSVRRPSNVSESPR